ncbi:MAG: hypothetical protein KDB68_09485 [Planctomycetes bacterium]|nr:hypothetical protein [Planctomycetota bacterium]
MTQVQAPREIRDLLGGRPGGVNRIIKRFGKPVVDYATALIPDRSEPFAKLVEDILVDVLSQARAAARAKSDEEVFEFVTESALRTVRSRYRDVLESPAKPTKATSSYSFKEVLARTSMTEAELTEGISSGRIRAVREDNEMKVKPDGISGLNDRKAHYAFHVTAAERELLCLHYRLGFSPEVIARWAGATPGQIEEMLATSSNNLAKSLAKKGETPERQDTEIRRYIDGRMGDDETAKFERGIIKDKIAQRRLDELRSQSDGIRELFDSDYYDLSSVAVNVRTRNPHHALALPPVAALWLQVVGIAAILLMFHSVGGYIAPPDVKVSSLVGENKLPAEGRLNVGGKLETDSGSQLLMVLDESNRVVLAPDTELQLLEPHADARQVLGVTKGEIWGRFTSAGYAFKVEFPVTEDNYAEIASDAGAEFDLIVGEATKGMLPDSLERERIRAFVGAFESDMEGLKAARALKAYANFRIGAGGEDAPGLKFGDRVESIDGVAIRSAEDFASAVRTMTPGESLQLTLLRGEERIVLPLTRLDVPPTAVVRVFHGALMAGARGGDKILVNRGQWALFTADQPPMIGLRGLEDFRVLRIDANERFKDRLHWLNTESYPLRAENNLLVVERALRDLALKLESYRADEIQRSGPREIANFEAIMRQAISDAATRIAQGNPRERGPGVESLSDEALVSAEDEILAIIQHWRRQSATGVYPTLGDAAKTLKSPILRFRDDLEARGEELTRAILMQSDIEKKDEAIKLQDDAINELKQSEFYDADGSKRATIDAAINDLEKQVRAAKDAVGRKELVMVKLNALDDKIDTQRRKLTGLNRAVTDAQKALDDVNALLEANVYTPEKLNTAELELQAAEENLKDCQAELGNAESTVSHAKIALSDSKEALKVAKEPIAGLTTSRDAANDALTDAVTNRSTAQTALDNANAEVDRLQTELDALAEDDPNRAAKQKELDAATTTRDDAQTTLDEASAAATAANKALDEATAALEEAQADVATVQESVDSAKVDLQTAEKRRDELAGDVKTAEGELKTAKAVLKTQQDAKTARALLDTRKVEAEGELAGAQTALADVEAKIADLETQAAPHREKLSTELALIEQGEDAKKAIEERRTERGRYQAISDDIDRRSKDRQALVTERDQLANSNLIVNYATLQDEYQALSARIDAFEFVSARGIIEDNNFALEQKAAQDRFREVAEDATTQALGVLDRYCPPYEDEAYQTFKGEEGAKLRHAVLEAMWKLYYDTGLNSRSDDEDIVCYYVAVQSGAGAESLSQLDNRWQAYLTEALGRSGFDELSGLSPDSLQAPKPADKSQGNGPDDE